jgi:hypothetical protein
MQREQLAMVRHRLITGSPDALRCLHGAGVCLSVGSQPSVVKEIVHIRHRMEIELAKEAEENIFQIKAGLGISGW